MYLALQLVLLSFAFENFVSSQLTDGDLCQFNDNQTGTCVEISNCPYAIKLLKSNSDPILCGFNKDVPIVCCDKVIHRNVAEEKCEEFKKYYASDETNSLHLPHAAILGYGHEAAIKWRCTGSLISEKFVVTAAICVNRTSSNVQFVKLGNLHGSTKKFKAAHVFFYTEYNKYSRYHDIALIELDSDVDLNGDIKPACLHTIKDLPEEKPIVAGLDVTNKSVQKSKVLFKTFRYVPYETCKNWYGPQAFLEGGIRDVWQMCATQEDQSINRCTILKRDRGKSLQIKLQHHSPYTLVGIWSFGRDCGNAPSVFTRISFYVPWIESVVWPH